MSLVLGIGGSDHDVHACLAADGCVLAAIEEERLTRRKYGLGGNLLDLKCVDYVLSSAGVSRDEVDVVALDRLLPVTVRAQFRRSGEMLDHHLCHAAAAYLTSPFERATVVVMDNAGCLTEWNGEKGLEATSVYLGEDGCLTLVDRVLSTNWNLGPDALGAPYQLGDGDHSLGSFYKRVTGALGFRFAADPAESEFYFPEDGVTMGLASYGDARFVDAYRALVELKVGGHYCLWSNDGRLDALLAGNLDGAGFEARAATAFAAQAVLSELVRHIVAAAVSRTGEAKLCLSGGVAMNSAATGDLLRYGVVEAVYTPPMPGDNGTGVGAALLRSGHTPPGPEAFSVYAGRRYGGGEAAEAAAALGGGAKVVRLGEGPLVDRVAELLAAGKVVGWFEGGAEMGRRALGHRSLLADPRLASMRDHVNSQVKRRQLFRPFAPVMNQAGAARWVALDQPSPYMQIIADVRPEVQGALQAVTHVDGTTRPQTLASSDHPRLSALLDRFGALTGTPVLLNTSFNGPGEPIVETPETAARGFDALALDALVVEDWLVVR